MTLVFRDATANDVDQLRKLALISYGEFAKVLSPENWKELRVHLVAENLFPGLLTMSKGFVCLCDDHLVGMAFLIPQGNPTPIFDASWSYIRMVGVHPEFSGHQIGRELTKRCIEFARASNEKIVALHTSEFMDAARHIYEKLGFTKVKELPVRYGKRYWVYQLEL